MDGEAARRRSCLASTKLYFGVRHATHREIEMKLPVSDVSSLILKLRRLNAIAFGRVFEKNTLYDTPDADLRRTGRLLRIRVETPARSSFSAPGVRSAMVTSKAPPAVQTSAKPRYKEKLERQLIIPGPKRWSRILSSLGFRAGFRYEKFRTAFRLPDIHLDLDETPAGTFLELEGEPKAMDRVARALGYSPGDYLQCTYWDIYVSDCRRRGVSPTNMVFVKKKIAK
jgi:adenylate cyclase class 2